MKTYDPSFVEIAALSGMDFIILDTEHGIASTKDLHNLVRAAKAGGSTAIVRVASNRPELIQTALDSGADGVQVPSITTVEDAQSVVKSSYFSPKGMRGVCRYVRAAQYSQQPSTKYFKQSNNVLSIIHLEGKQALENAEAIAEINDIDILFIGPWDLSQSLGIPGEIHHPKMLKAIKGLAEKLKPRGKVLGTFLDDLEDLKEFSTAGIQYFGYGTDVGLFSQKCQNLNKSIHSMIKQ